MTNQTKYLLESKFSNWISSDFNNLLTPNISVNDPLSVYNNPCGKLVGKVGVIQKHWDKGWNSEITFDTETKHWGKRILKNSHVLESLKYFL